MKKLALQFSITTLLCFGVVTAFAQKTITGTVTSDSIKVLAGVTVEVLGSTVATLTDQDGRYGVSAGDESVLVFRLQGYIAQEVPVHGRTQINVVLQRNTDSLSLAGRLIHPALLSRKVKFVDALKPVVK